MLELIKRLQQQRGMAVMLITHDLGVVAEMADRVAVMYAGQLVEQAPRDVFFGNSQHPYSDRLFAALPDSSKREQRLTVIPGTVPPLNQVFYGLPFCRSLRTGMGILPAHSPGWFETGAEQGVRCHLADRRVSPGVSRTTEVKLDAAAKIAVKTSTQRALLDVEDLKVHFPIHKGLFKRIVGQVRAVDGVSLSIPADRLWRWSASRAAAKPRWARASCNCWT